MVFITVCEKRSNKDLKEYEGYDWDVRIDLADRPQVHMLRKKHNTLTILLRWKKPWYIHNVKSSLFSPDHYSSGFPKVLYRKLFKTPGDSAPYTGKEEESNFPTVPSHQSSWKINLTVSLRHHQPQLENPQRAFQAVLEQLTFLIWNVTSKNFLVEKVFQ